MQGGALAGVLLLLGVGCASGESYPQPQGTQQRVMVELTVVNQSGEAATAVYLSPDDAPGSESQLLEEPLAAGAQVMALVGTGRWSLRAELASGREVLEPGLPVEGPVTWEVR